MPFRPKRMATAGPIAIYSELRASVPGHAWGEGREHHVQPDLALVRAHAPDPVPSHDVLLVLEANQHWRAKQREWGYALADYARVFSEADVAVLSHRRARTTTA